MAIVDAWLTEKISFTQNRRLPFDACRQFYTRSATFVALVVLWVSAQRELSVLGLMSFRLKRDDWTGSS